jgi:hypothetical protein
MKNSAEAVHLHVGGVAAGAEDAVVFLAANRSGLRRAGVDLQAFDPVPAGEDSIAGFMPPPGADAATVEAAAATLSARLDAGRSHPQPRFLITAPDLAGPAAELLLGRFHGNARLRARTLARALGRRVDRLVMTIQPYEALFHSVWMSLAVERLIDPFADYAAGLASFRGGWAELAEIWIEELDAGELVVLADPLTPQQLLPHLLPGVALRQPVLPRPRPRVTPSAVAMAQRCFAQGMKLQAGQRDRLIEFHARQPQHRPDFGFSTLALADLRGRYVADLDSIARMAGVTLVGGLLPALAAE